MPSIWPWDGLGMALGWLCPASPPTSASATLCPRRLGFTPAFSIATVVFLTPPPVIRQMGAAKPDQRATQRAGNEALIAETVSLAVVGPLLPREPETQPNPPH